jgi:serine/threonine protein kinase
MTQDTENRHPFDPATGLLNGRYELLEFVGQGSMGAVYKAQDRELDRIVAIKCVLNAEAFGSNERAMREAKTLANLSHPNIIRVYDVVAYRDQVSLVTEWVEGRTLNELSVPLGTAEVIAIAAQLFRGLAAAHKLRIFHRDIKPANIMLAKDGRLVLLDFGVAFTPGNSSGETIAGSLRYAAPEVLEGHPPTEQSDIFAAGLVISELLLGYALVPDLAPLPLYRFHQEKFNKITRRSFNGIYPPLGQYLLEYLNGKSLVVHPSGLAERSASLMHELLHELTDKSVEDFLAQTICIGLRDTTASDQMMRKTEAALENPELSPKEKAQWFAFQDSIQASAGSSDSPRLSIARKLTAKLPAKNTIRRFSQMPVSNQIGWSVGSVGLALLVTTLALYFSGRSDSGQHDLTSAGQSSSSDTTPPNQAVQDVKNAVKEAVREAVQEAVNQVSEDQTASQSQAAQPVADTSATKTSQNKPSEVNSAQVSDSAQARTTANKASQAKVDQTLSRLGTKLPEKTAAPKTSETANERIPVRFAANAWAEISIDGLNVGRLPSTKEFEVKTGTRKIRLESPFVETLETEILVTKAPEQRFKFTLKPKNVVRVIRLANPGQIIIDGEDHGYGAEKTINLSYGNHEVWIKRGDLGVEKQQIAVGPDTPEVIVVE